MVTFCSNHLQIDKKLTLTIIIDSDMIYLFIEILWNVNLLEILRNDWRLPLSKSWIILWIKILKYWNYFRGKDLRRKLKFRTRNFREPWRGILNDEIGTFSTIDLFCSSWWKWKMSIPQRQENILWRNGSFIRKLIFDLGDPPWNDMSPMRASYAHKI